MKRFCAVLRIFQNKTAGPAGRNEDCLMRLGRIQNDWSAEGFDLVVRQKLDFIEICSNNDEEADAVIAAQNDIKAQIARTGIPISCLGRWNHYMMHDGKIEPAEIERYEKHLDAAAALGAKTFVCGCNYDDSVSLFRNYDNAIRFLGPLCERGRKKGVKVAVHNCDWNNYIVSPKQWEVVLGELPDLYIKFDPSHSYNRGGHYLDELADWGERVAHLHIKGTTHAGSRGVDDPPAGMDDIRWPSVFAILYSRDYDGDLSIEPHSGAWLGDRGEFGVAFTRDYIRKFLP